MNVIALALRLKAVMKRGDITVNMLHAIAKALLHNGSEPLAINRISFLGFPVHCRKR